MANQKDNQLQIDIAPDVARGVYSNFAIISHSRAEFIIDLASSLPGSPKAQVVSRVVLAPEHAKRLLLALQENVMRYEKEHGQIPLESAAKPSVPRTANPFGEA
jgi:hypothetical protein